ncbi:MAG TPA: cation:dicarboxylase symporter family transporter [Spirochaetia bacterium]|nr:cation:dicarboxylase symporter family transporter [Spirochaetia bacterium]
MKIWMRFLAGGIVGLLIGLYLPLYGGDTLDLFRFLDRLVLNIGKYVVFPMVFFGLASGIRELKEERAVFSTIARAIAYIMAATAALAFLGALSVTVLSPERVPIVVQEASAQTLPTVRALLLQVFPGNALQVLQFHDFLLPLLVLALVVGLTLNSPGLYSSPVTDLFDSMSRILYRINSVVFEVIGIGFIALAAYSALELRQLGDMELFRQLFITIVFTAALVALVLIPLAVYFFGGRQNPLQFLYAMVAPALAALFSRDAYFSLGILTRVGREELRVPRKQGSILFPLNAVFCRSGSAMVTAIAFILVLRSYSSLELSLVQFVWVILLTFLTSFLLGAAPGVGVMVSLSLLSRLYGRGLENGYLILQAAGPILVSIGAFLDVAVSGTIAYLLAGSERKRTEVSPR